MFIEDIQGCDNVVLDDMNEDIVMSHVSVIVLHIVAVLFGQPIVTFNSGAEWLKTFVES